MGSDGNVDADNAPLLVGVHRHTVVVKLTSAQVLRVALQVTTHAVAPVKVDFLWLEGRPAGGTCFRNLRAQGGARRGGIIAGREVRFEVLGCFRVDDARIVNHVIAGKGAALAGPDQRHVAIGDRCEAEEPEAEGSQCHCGCRGRRQD